MFHFLIKRVLSLIPILLAVSIAVFFLIRLSPSDPITSITSGKRLNDETRAALVRRFHLDKSLPQQYIIWVTGLFRGDLGTSYRYNQSAASLIGARLPTTIQLVFMATVFAFLISIPAGVLAAVKKNMLADRGVSLFMVLCVSSPAFLNAIVLMLLFSLRVKIFPSFGTGRGFVQNLYYLFLPALALSFSMTALMGRICRSRMIDELAMPYALALKAKGTPFTKIVFRHCLKNALLPVITVAGIWMGSMVVGSALVENVFALGGIGQLLVDSIKASDYPVVQSIIMMMVALFMLISLLIDALYAVIDPRVRQASFFSLAQTAETVNE